MTDEHPPFPDDVDVAVVSHNGRQTLPRVLACLEATGAPPARITVYDIASTDGTAAWMADTRPGVRVVTLPHNAGPNPARNMALQRASRPFLLLVDSDGYLRPGAVAELRRGATEVSVAAVVPVVVHHNAPDRIQYASASLHFICEAINPWMNRPLSERGLDIASIGTAPGVSLLLRVDHARHIGGFDDRYFMGKEDGEFCYRLRVAGYRIIEMPGAVAEHESRPRSTWLYRYQIRNRWHFILKNYELRTLVAIAPALLVHEPLQLAALTAQGQLVAWIRAVAGLLSWLPQLPADRRAVRRLRVVHDRQLLRADPLVLRADVAGRRPGRALKQLYDRWLAFYWRRVCALLA